MTEVGPEDERLQGIYERLEELDPATFEADASKLLHGLGFDEKMMAKCTKDMSGASDLPFPIVLIDSFFSFSLYHFDTLRALANG